MQIENLKVFFRPCGDEKLSRKSAKLNGLTQSAVSQQARAWSGTSRCSSSTTARSSSSSPAKGCGVYESGQGDPPHERHASVGTAGDEEGHQRNDTDFHHLFDRDLHELPPYIKRFLHDFPSVNVRVEYRRSESGLRGHPAQRGRFPGSVAFPAKMRQVRGHSVSTTTSPGRDHPSPSIPSPSAVSRDRPTWRGTSSSASTPIFRRARRSTRFFGTTGSKSSR